jgi:hypothetical protein
LTSSIILVLFTPVFIVTIVVLIIHENNLTIYIVSYLQITIGELIVYLQRINQSLSICKAFEKSTNISSQDMGMN